MTDVAGFDRPRAIERLQELACDARVATDQPALVEPIPPTAPLAGYIDSMAVAVLVVLIEEEWRIELEEEEIDPDNFASLTSLAGLIEVKYSAGA